MNSISPSLVDTPMARASEASGDFPGVDVVGPMVPLGRAGTPADIAAACSYLCSEEGGSYITGQILGSTVACTSRAGPPCPYSSLHAGLMDRIICHL